MQHGHSQNKRTGHYGCFKVCNSCGSAYRKCHRYNDGNVKGTIDVARHITKNTPFIGNIAYSQREFSYDNDLMELIRHTIEYIKRKPYGNHLLAKVRDEVKLVVEVTLPGSSKALYPDFAASETSDWIRIAPDIRDSF